MEWWHVFGLIFLVFAGMYIYTQIASKVEESNRNMELQKWDEQEISKYLVRQKANPPLVRHYVETVKNRFINNQDTKVAQTRVKFLEQQVISLGLANQYADLQMELNLKGQQYQNKLLTLQVEHQNLQLGLKDVDEEQELRRLENQKRRLESELHIAKIKKEFDLISNPPQPSSAPQPDEIREKKMKGLKDRISRINARIKEVRDDPSLSDDECQTQINQLERKKFDLNEQLTDLI